MSIKPSRSALCAAVLIGLYLFSRPPAAGADVRSAAFAATQDAAVYEEKGDRTYGVLGDITVTSRDRPNENRPYRNSRALVGFDISSVPPGSVIEAADLRLWSEAQPAVQRTYNAHRLQNSWLEGSGLGSVNSPALNGATWFERQFGDNAWTGSGLWDWSSAGGDYLGTPTASAPTPASDGWMSWNVIGDVQAFTDGVANFGWLIRDSAENSGQSRVGRFASRETPDTALRPSLVVTYLRAGAVLSVDTVSVGSATPMRVLFAGTAGTDGDQVKQVSFNIPAGWGQIPTAAGDYTVNAPSGKQWNITGAPTGPDGPQTVTLAAAGGADDLAAGEMLEIVFNVRAPWLAGNSDWTFSATGAAGGVHTPPAFTTTATSGTLAFDPGADQAMNFVALSGLDATAAGTLGIMTVRDARGSGSGWSVTVSATDFVNQADPAQIIPATGFVVPVEPAVSVVDGSNPPTGAGGCLAGAGLELVRAEAGAGAGEYRIVPDLELAVPADTMSGDYSTTITETIIGGL